MKPAKLVLDLLRTYERNGTSVKNLMSTASLFSINENLMRVTLSRLAARGLIERVSRGHYRLTNASDPISEFVEEWRLGEQRRRPWQGRYLLAQATKYQHKDTWIMNITGFRPLNPGLWARPDNLRRQGDELIEWLTGLGLEASVVVVSDASLTNRDAGQLMDQYELRHLELRLKRLRNKLESSLTRLATLPQKTAMKQSFYLGGEALELLAKDPYLPEEIQNPDERQQLWQTMINYDAAGRLAWSESPTTMPAPITTYA